MPLADRPHGRPRAETAERILAAAFEQLRDAPEAPFSHEIVAERAGISARTVYRHFPTQADLVQGVWRQLRDRSGTTWPRRRAPTTPWPDRPKGARPSGRRWPRGSRNSRGRNRRR